MNSNETYKYDSTEVAKYIVARAKDAAIPMNMTKLQKLLYVAYGIYLRVKHERLTNEHPQAWPYGPVFPATRTNLLHINFENPPFSAESEDLNAIAGDSDAKSLIDLVFRIFGDWTAGQLTEWSHDGGSPWERTKCSVGFKWGWPIPDEYIEDYFQKIIIHAKDEEATGN